MADDLVLKAIIDTSGVATGMRIMTADVAHATEKMEKGLHGVFEIGKGVVGGGVGLEIIKTAAEFFEKAIKSGAEIAEGAERIGVTTDEYQQLAYAAKQSGVDVGGLEKAFNSVSKLSVDPEASKKLEAIGISLEEFKNAGQYERFKMIAASLEGIQDPGQRAAMAIEYLGKSGNSLLPMLSQVGVLGEELKNIGGIMDRESVEASHNFEKGLNRLTTQAQTLVANSGLIPWLADLTEKINAAKTGTENLEKSLGVKLHEENGWKRAGRWALRATPGLNAISASDYFLTGKTLDERLMGPDSSYTESGKKSDIEIVEERRKRLAEQAAKDKANQSAKDLADSKMREEEAKALEKEKKEIEKLDAEIAAHESEIAMDKAKADTEAALKDAEKVARQVEYISAKREELAIQKLIADGKEKEAAIAEELNRAQKAGLNKEDAAKTAAMAGDLFDLKNKQRGDFRLPDHTDSLLRIGGTIGKGAVGNDGATLQRKTNDLVSTLIKTVQEQTAKWDKYAMREAGND